VTLLSAVDAVDETPIDRFLAEQAELTAVERFSQRHEAELVPRQSRYYRDLIPLAAPEPGQQYGFEVDLDSCTGCKACVAACHSLNGLDDGESWRSVTVVSGGTAAAPFQQTVTAACHHCLDPACLSGCPVDAYEKDPVTGVVFHLDDQCIGCSYCTLSCPYEVPVYNHGRGIVRKCDMCHGRLAAGEAPACVQACPNGAIAITVVDIASVRAVAMNGSVVPGAPPSSITAPTTVYRTVHGRVHELPSARPRAGPARSHTPLAVMLVLTQLSVGAFITDLGLRALAGGRPVPGQTFDAAVALAAGVLALAASVLHLGRPRYAYRAVIGLRHSWLSREVVAFGVFTALAAAYASVLWLGWPASATLAAAVAVAGLAGIGCSVLIYTTTHRSSWRPAPVLAKFGLTTAVGGVATVLWASLVSGWLAGRTAGAAGRGLPLLLAALVVLELGVETVWHGVRHAELRVVARARRAAAVVCGVVLPILLAENAAASAWLRLPMATLVLAGVVTGELLERSLFFTTASPPR
jgi:Fe-S-cluster-containing dehydrogenase component/DMSO reductase anchor subunit